MADVLSGEGPVTTDDLDRFAETFRDLGDRDLMRRAWEGAGGSSTGRPSPGSSPAPPPNSPG